MRVLILIGYTPRTTIFTSTVWGVSANLPTIVGRISSFKHEPNFVVGGILVLLVVSPSSVVYIRRPRLQQGDCVRGEIASSKGQDGVQFGILKLQAVAACDFSLTPFRTW